MTEREGEGGRETERENTTPFPVAQDFSKQLGLLGKMEVTQY